METTRHTTLTDCVRRRRPQLLPILLLSFFTHVHCHGDAFTQQRTHLVRMTIELRGVKDEATLNAMHAVPRHEFVPDDLRRSAYLDGPLPIGHGQTISQPYIVAYMTEALQLQAEHKVLEIGTGSGYQAAVLAEIVKEVYSIEIIPELAKEAEERLKRLQYTNVHLKQADGFHGWADKGPFDAIIVTAAAEFIPPPLVAQLKEGGRMMIPLGKPFGSQYLVLVTRRDGKARTETLLPVRFVPFTRGKR